VLVLMKPKRALAIVAAFLGAVLYVWFAAVRAVPGVQARKRAFRASRARRRSA
jgi:hypothetical protein